MRESRLRFKNEYGDNYPNWEEKSLGEIGRFQTSSVDKLVRENEDQVYIVNYMNVYNHDKITKNSLYKLQKVTAKKTQIISNDLKKGDILFTPSSETRDDIGHSVVVFEDLNNCVYSYHLIRFRPNTNLDILYSHYFCNNNKVLSQIVKLSTGSTRFTVSLKSFSTIEVSFPDIEEQEKIGNFFTLLDKNLELQEAKLEELKKYKKGIMKKLFSQEIRFKDENGNNYSDWEEKKLGEIGISYNGLTGKKKDDFGEGKAYITYKQIFDNSKIDISKFEFVKITEIDNQNNVKYGDVLFTTSSETPNEVGYSSVMLDDIDEVYLNSFSFGYRIKNFKVLLPNFAKYFFRSSELRNEIIKLAQGSTRFNMSKTKFMEIVVLLPIFFEQQKIANFLSSIDNRIEKEKEKLKELKKMKKGLLQKMFV